MKTITKTLYLDDKEFEKIKSGILLGISHESKNFRNKITVSWQEPERKIEITESEFQEKLRKSVPINWTNELVENISKRFFGASDERN